MNAEWVGRDCKFVWRRASNFGSFEFGSEPFGASSGAPDPALDYLVQVLDASGKTLRTEYVKETSYIYSYERNFEDTGGAPLRSFTVKVWARNTYLISSLPATLDVSNPAPPVPTAIATTPGAGSITISCALPADTDVLGLLIWRSTSSGFTPGAGNLVYQGPNSSVVFDGLTPNNTYYFRIAAFDTFGTDQLNTSSEFSAAPVPQLSAISQDLGDIVAGSIRGVNVNASSHTTKGSYLTSALSGGETTVNVRHTDDFPASGSAVIIDTSNDRDVIAYTGKTAGTLTGCSGVLAHNNGATIIPLAKGIVIDAETNEIRFYGDRGDGTTEELASIGLNSLAGDVFVGIFGSANCTRGPIKAFSKDFAAIQAQSSGTGDAISGDASGTANGLQGHANSGFAVSGFCTSGNGGAFFGNATRGNIILPNIGSSFPSDKAITQLATVGNRVFYADGAAWLPLTNPYFESSEQTLTANAHVAVAHGLGRIPKDAAIILRNKTTEFGYAVNDEVLSGYISLDAGNQRGITLYANATNTGFTIGNLINIADRTGGSVGGQTSITLANWKAVLRAS